MSQKYHFVKCLPIICMYVLSLVKCIYNSGLHSKSSRCTVLEAFLKALYTMRMQINTWPRILEVRLLLSAWCILVLG